jgi:hypothetical protein
LASIDVRGFLWTFTQIERFELLRRCTRLLEWEYLTVVSALHILLHAFSWDPEKNCPLCCPSFLGGHISMIFQSALANEFSN